jgi:UDP-N-acetylglucosamine 1-carboxyvinyltransferase
VDKLVIEGGNRLEGAVPISGAKNAVLPLMAATLLASDEFHLTNVPDLRDVHTMAELLRELGADVTFGESHLDIDTRTLETTTAPYELVKKMRASVLVLGPLLARTGEASVPLPGGCAIGTRPIDLHLSGLEQMGATVNVEHGDVKARADRLQGSDIYLDFPSVGATENLMMAAALAEGTTTIENAAREPEIDCLGEFISKMGADVEVNEGDEVSITGRSELNSADHQVVGDRIEAGTFLIAGAITDGSVRTEKVNPDNLQSVTNKLKQAGYSVTTTENSISVDSDQARPEPVDIVTLPYPGFPTDMQAQFMALMTLADGTATVKETIFEDRFMHVLELERLGADIKIEGNTVTVHGVDGLSGAPVMATDLRASAALVLAGLTAEGRTDVRRIYHLDRGYEDLEDKLRQLGATVRREEAEGP